MQHEGCGGRKDAQSVGCNAWCSRRGRKCSGLTVTLGQWHKQGGQPGKRERDTLYYINKRRRDEREDREKERKKQSVCGIFFSSDGTYFSFDPIWSEGHNCGLSGNQRKPVTFLLRDPWLHIFASSCGFKRKKTPWVQLQYHLSLY